MAEGVSCPSFGPTLHYSGLSRTRKRWGVCSRKASRVGLAAAARGLGGPDRSAVVAGEPHVNRAPDIVGRKCFGHCRPNGTGIVVAAKLLYSNACNGGSPLPALARLALNQRQPGPSEPMVLAAGRRHRLVDVVGKKCFSRKKVPPRAVTVGLARASPAGTMRPNSAGQNVEPCATASGLYPSQR
jgi:hypothetical protein